MEQVGVADMISMDHLTEELLLANLEKRFKKDIIYVCVFFIYKFKYAHVLYKLCLCINYRHTRALF